MKILIGSKNPGKIQGIYLLLFGLVVETAIVFALIILGIIKANRQ